MNYIFKVEIQTRTKLNPSLFGVDTPEAHQEVNVNRPRGRLSVESGGADTGGIGAGLGSVELVEVLEIPVAVGRVLRKRLCPRVTKRRALSSLDCTVHNRATFWVRTILTRLFLKVSYALVPADAKLSNFSF